MSQFKISDIQNSRAQTCVIYCRVSTKGQAQEGDSLEKQEEKCTYVAQRKGLKVVMVYKEPYTGKKEHRPVLDEMLSFLLKNRGKVGHVIFLDIGRASRGGDEGFTGFDKVIRTLGVNLIDAAGIIQPEINYLEEYGDVADYAWAKRRPSKASEVLYAEMKNQEVNDMLVRLIGREIQLTQEGYWIGQYPFGFKSNKIKTMESGTKKRTILVEDHNEAVYIKKMFELKAEGFMSDSEIVHHINQMGYRSRKRHKWDKLGLKCIGTIGGKKLNVEQLNKYLKMPIYAGIIRKKWTNMQPIDAQFPGLVSLQVWNRANEGRIIVKRGVDRKLEWFESDSKKRAFRYVHPDYPYKAVVRCHLCGGLFRGSASTGYKGKRYPSYHCTNGHSRVSVPAKEFNEIVENYVRSISLGNEQYVIFKRFVEENYQKDHIRLMETAKKKGEVVQELRSKLDLLCDKLLRTTSAVVEKRIEQDIEKLDAEIKAAESERNETELTEHDVSQYLRFVRKTMERPAEFLLIPRTKREMQRLWGDVFEELPTFTELVDGTPKLALFFKLKSTFESASSRVAGDADLTWNEFRSEIIRWKENLDQSHSFYALKK